MARHDETLLMTRRGAAMRAGVAMQTVEKEIKDGNLRVCRIRGRIMVHPDDFGEWIDRCRGLVTHEKVGSIPTSPTRKPKNETS